LDEVSVAMMAGFVDTLGLKKVGTPSGNVPVVGDGSDCFKQKSPFMNSPEIYDIPTYIHIHT
jgi:hypothetical protein